MVTDRRSEYEDLEDQMTLEKRALRRGITPEVPQNFDLLRLDRAQGYFNYATSKILIKNIDLCASVVPPKKLVRTSLKTLKFEKRTKNKYLALHSLEPAIAGDGLNTIVEDHLGNFMLFSVFNLIEMAESRSSEVIKTLLPKDTTFILKEPYVTRCNEFNILLCFCPSDMIVANEGTEHYPLIKEVVWKHPLQEAEPEIAESNLKTAEEWIEHGNRLFDECQFELSIRSHLVAASALEENLKFTYLKLAEANYEEGFFEKALTFADKVLWSDTENEEALTAAARSCYKLRRYKEAGAYFDKLLKSKPDSQSEMNIIKKELDENRMRIKEQDTGEFEMYKHYVARDTNSKVLIDCAEYTGPIDRVAKRPQRYSMIARTDIEPGTLLSVSKALAYASIQKSKVDFQWILVPDPGTVMQTPEWQDLVPQLVKRIHRNPVVYSNAIYELYDGRAIKEVKYANEYSAPDEMVGITDMKRLNDIVHYNVIVDTVNFHRTKAIIEDETTCSLTFGVFSTPSCFYHSCLPNTSVHVFNDTVFVRATQFIHAGEEAFIPYVSWKVPYEFRKKVCSRLGFRCECKLCEYDRKFSIKETDLKKHILKQLKVYYVSVYLEDLFPEEIDAFRANIYQKVRELDEDWHNGDVSLFHKKSATALMYFLISMTYGMGLSNSKNWNHDEEVRNLVITLDLFGFDPKDIFACLTKENTVQSIPPNAILDELVLILVSRIIMIYSYGIPSELTKERKAKWTEVLVALEKIYSGGGAKVIWHKYPRIKDFIMHLK